MPRKHVRQAPGAHTARTFLFAAAVGVIGGLVGVVFRLCGRGLQHHIIGAGNLLVAAEQLSWYWRLLIPFGGACVASLLAYGLTRKRESQGMSDVMEAITLRRAQGLSARATISRALSSLALIATGGSVGREGPIVYMSASFGARLSRWARVPVPSLGLFAGAGVAAGMAAAYYAPFGAALFALEVVLGNFAVDLLAPVVVSSVVASVVGGTLASTPPISRVIHGPPLYDLPRFSASHPTEYVFYLLLGVLAAGAAWLFIRTMQETERFFKSLPLRPLFRLPLGGLVVGIIGIWVPHVWGNGYEAADLVLKHAPALWFVAVLFLLKILATSVTIGSGGSGGIFTPTLFIGVSLGLLAGEAGHSLFPGIVANAAPYAVVGMAATLAATTQAPIMAIFILFEMTKEPSIVVPLMVATIAASVGARALGLESVYFASLKRRGLHIPEGIEETALTTTRVADIMREGAVWVSNTANFDTVVGKFQKSRRDSIYVLDGKGRLQGAIRLHDVKNYLSEEELGTAVIAADLIVSVPAAHAEQSVAEILDIFDDPEMSEMPVVEATDSHLIGVVDRRDLISALSVEVLQKPSLRAKFVTHGGASHYVEMPRGHAISRIDVPPNLVGSTFGKADFRKVTGLSVLTIVRQEDGREVRLLPESGIVLEKSDSFIVIGPKETIRELGGNV